MPRRRVALALKALIAISTIFVAVLAGELVLRAVGYDYSSLHIEVPTQGDWRYEHAFRDKTQYFDDESLFNAEPPARGRARRRAPSRTHSVSTPLSGEP